MYVRLSQSRSSCRKSVRTQRVIPSFFINSVLLRRNNITTHSASLPCFNSLRKSNIHLILLLLKPIFQRKFCFSFVLSLYYLIQFGHPLPLFLSVFLWFPNELVFSTRENIGIYNTLLISSFHSYFVVSFPIVRQVLKVQDGSLLIRDTEWVGCFHHF